MFGFAWNGILQTKLILAFTVSVSKQDCILWRLVNFIADLNSDAVSSVLMRSYQYTIGACCPLYTIIWRQVSTVMTSGDRWSLGVKQAPSVVWRTWRAPLIVMFWGHYMQMDMTGDDFCAPLVLEKIILDQCFAPGNDWHDHHWPVAVSTFVAS